MTVSTSHGSGVPPLSFALHPDPKKPRRMSAARFTGPEFDTSFIDALEVLAGRRIHLDPFAFLDEKRDVDHGARGKRGRFRGSGGRVALDARLAVDDLQGDA